MRDLNVKTISEQLKDIAKKLNKFNASDADISNLNWLADVVSHLEQQPTARVAFYAGWQEGKAAAELRGQGGIPPTVYGSYNTFMDDIEACDVLKAEDVAQPPDHSCLANIGLVDLDTGATMKVSQEQVDFGPIFQGQFIPAQQAMKMTGFGMSTERGELLDRVAKLETEMVNLRRDMGERIRDLSTGKAFKGRRG